MTMRAQDELLRDGCISDFQLLYSPECDGLPVITQPNNINKPTSKIWFLNKNFIGTLNISLKRITHGIGFYMFMVEHPKFTFSIVFPLGLL